MSRNYIFCHGCHSTAPENQANFADGEVTCPNCGSDFVEITDAPPVQEPVHGPPVLMPGAASWESLLGVSNGTTRIVRFGGNGGGGLTITMASGGAPPMGPLYGGPMGMPMGDLDLHAVLQHVRLVLEQSGVATGDLVEGPNGQAMTMDDLMSQIMQQYQPHFVPTAPDARQSLPRRTVGPRRASSKALMVNPEERTPSTEHDGDAAGGAAATVDSAAAHAGDTCTVCHDDYEEGATVVELPCTHCFHEDCIMPWLETHNTCPVCRKELPPDPNAPPPPQPERAPGPPSLTQMLQGLTGMGGQPEGGQQAASAGCAVM